MSSGKRLRWRRRRSPVDACDAGEVVAAYVLTAGVLLYGVGFLTVGGEWFAMWQSVSWNGQNNAHIFFMLGAVALLHLSGPEA